MSDFLIIHGVINCSRISKSRLFRKKDDQGNEKPGQYLKIVLVQKKEKDQWGNTIFFIKEDTTKEERDAGVEGQFIGDAKIYAPKSNNPKPPPPTARTKKPGAGGVPF